MVVELDVGEGWELQEARVRNVASAVRRQGRAVEIDAGQEGTLRLAFVSRGGVSEEVACGYFSPGDAFTVLRWGRGLRCVPREMARRTPAQAPAAETGQ